MSLCFTQSADKMSFSALNKVSELSFSRPQGARSSAFRSPHWVARRGSMGWCSLIMAGQNQQSYSPPAPVVPAAICLLWVEYDMKIFLIFLQPLLCLLPESYLDQNEVEEVNALRLLEQPYTIPFLPDCEFSYDCDTKTRDRHFFSARLSV